MSKISCFLGVLFVLSIALLHASGFSRFTSEMNQSNASAFLKDMFPVLYAMPILYLATLAAFGVLAMFDQAARRSICLVLAPAVFAAGALALMLGEWVPVVIMSLGASLFVAAALTTTSTRANTTAEPNR